MNRLELIWSMAGDNFKFKFFFPRQRRSEQMATRPRSRGVRTRRSTTPRRNNRRHGCRGASHARSLVVASPEARPGTQFSLHSDVNPSLPPTIITTKTVAKHSQLLYCYRCIFVLERTQRRRTRTRGETKSIFRIIPLPLPKKNSYHEPFERWKIKKFTAGTAITVVGARCAAR